jgi:RNA polymerase sigma-70 factor, ECF subfamily
MAEVTLQLLRRWNGGDAAALGALIERHQSAVREIVQRRAGRALLARAEADDFVQDAIVRFLESAPRLEIRDDEHFRRLLARVVENVLVDKANWFSARRRDLARERPFPNDGSFSLVIPANRETPSLVARKEEEEAWMRLALDLLDPEARELIALRTFEKKSHAEIGEKLGIGAHAARLRYTRALARLGKVVTALRAGAIDAAVAASEAGAAP